MSGDGSGLMRKLEKKNKHLFNKQPQQLAVVSVKAVATAQTIIKYVKQR